MYLLHHALVTTIALTVPQPEKVNCSPSHPAVAFSPFPIEERGMKILKDLGLFGEVKIAEKNCAATGNIEPPSPHPLPANPEQKWRFANVWGFVACELSLIFEV